MAGLHPSGADPADPGHDEPAAPDEHPRARGGVDHEHTHAHPLAHDPHGHDHHSHSHSHPAAGRAASAFRWSVVLNSGLTALQLAIGFGFGSLALIGDALHNLGDVVGLALGWGADRLSRRPARGRFTYGFGRSTQMASLINGLLIFAAGAVVVVEAIQRLLQPVPLTAGPVAWAAAAGIVINLLSARLFGHDHQHDLNQRAAVLHLLTDAAVSVAVLLSALVVAATGWFCLDALTAIGVGGAVIWSALGLLREALALNLDAAPRHVDLARVEAALASLPAVLAVEELHVWSLSTSRTALTSHLRIDPARLHQDQLGTDQLLALAQRRLAELGIRKSTLQLETTAERHHHEPVRSGPPEPRPASRDSRGGQPPAPSPGDPPGANPAAGHQTCAWTEGCGGEPPSVERADTGEGPLADKQPLAGQQPTAGQQPSSRQRPAAGPAS